MLAAHPRMRSFVLSTPPPVKYLKAWNYALYLIKYWISYLKGALPWNPVKGGLCPWTPSGSCMAGVTGEGGTGGIVPQTLTGKYLLTYRENRGKEKRKMERKRREMQKGKVENWKWKELKTNVSKRFLSCFFFRRLSFFFFEADFVFVWFSFQNHWNCFGSTKMGIFYGKKHLTPGKIRKMTFPPQKNIPLTPLPSGALIGGPGFHSWVLALRARCLSLQAIPKSWKPWINRSQNS